MRLFAIFSSEEIAIENLRFDPIHSHGRVRVYNNIERKESSSRF